MDKKKIVSIVVFVLLVVVFGFIIYDSNNKEKKIVNKDINSEISSALKEKKNLVIYVENSDSKKCKNCDEIKKYVDSKNIKYILFDEKELGKDKYNKMLDMLSIPKDVFNYPALIYVSDGIMFANIINIEEKQVIDQFIKDYDLTNVK